MSEPQKPTNAELATTLERIAMDVDAHSDFLLSDVDALGEAAARLRAREAPQAPEPPAPGVE